MERKICLLDVRTSAAGELGSSLEGYASIKHVIDSYGDVILDGAYGDLAEFVRSGFVAVGHDHSGIPVGFITRAIEDSKGLLVGMEFHSTGAAKAAQTVTLERLHAGKRVGLSIGYLPLEWGFESREGKRVRLLKRIELKEFSLVSLPAVADAVVTRIKGAQDADLQIEQLASEWNHLQYGPASGVFS